VSKAAKKRAPKAVAAEETKEEKKEESASEGEEDQESTRADDDGVPRRRGGKAAVPEEKMDTDEKESDGEEKDAEATDDENTAAAPGPIRRRRRHRPGVKARRDCEKLWKKSRLIPRPLVEARLRRFMASTDRTFAPLIHGVRRLGRERIACAATNLIQDMCAHATSNARASGHVTHDGLWKGVPFRHTHLQVAFDDMMRHM
jgi:hypothetical protein